MYGRRKLKELGDLEWTGVRLRAKFGIGNFRAMESEMGSKERGVGEGHRIEIVQVSGGLSLSLT